MWRSTAGTILDEDELVSADKVDREGRVVRLGSSTTRSSGLSCMFFAFQGCFACLHDETVHVLVSLFKTVCWLQYYNYEANSLSGNNGPHYVAVATTKVFNMQALLPLKKPCSTFEYLLWTSHVGAYTLWQIMLKQGELLYLFTIAASEPQWKKSKTKLKKVAESFSVWAKPAACLSFQAETCFETTILTCKLQDKIYGRRNCLRHSVDHYEYLYAH